MLGLFVRALFAFQRRTARRLGVPRPRTGAVAFVQRFGSALQLTPHFHVLLPESVFEEVGEGTTTLLPLPSPTDDEVERMAATVPPKVPPESWPSTRALSREPSTSQLRRTASGCRRYVPLFVEKGWTKAALNAGPRPA